MALSTQPYKGARDFYPEAMRLERYIFDVWRQACERFGYEAYDAPMLEPTELYLNKGNEEIIKDQTYTFTDRGGRSVTMRTEMTPTVSRMVAGRRQELAYPLRLYSIPQCWRYERMQRGRGREFYQLNADVFGVDGLEADFEAIELADTIMRDFKAKRDMYIIKINSRKLVDYLLTGLLGVDDTQSQSLIRLIDHMHKLDPAEFMAQLDAVFSPTQRDEGKSERLLAFLKASSLPELPVEASHEAVAELKRLFDWLERAKITNAVFDPTLMRGFDYYTDITFEVFDTNAENNRSMFGGGRYDGLVGVFGVEPISAVGFAMGDITLQNFLESHGLSPKLPPTTDVYVALIGDVYERAQTAIAELREMGVNAAVDVTGRKLDKQIKTAEKNGIHYVLFVGEAELESGLFTLKNLHTGTEEKHGIQRCVSIIKDYRAS